MHPILEIAGISKKYTIRHEQQQYVTLRDSLAGLFRPSHSSREEFLALDNISLSVNPGESIGVIGRNGAGKSTLLKILSRITPPSKGTITTRGRLASLLEVGTGFHPELTGRENIFFNGSILGMSRSEIRASFDEIVDFAGTEKFLDTALKQYSSGMQLRLAFAVAAFLRAEIVVIDEVLAVGDAEFQKKCLGKMEDVSKEGRTILFVSHNLTAVSQLCKNSVMLDHGKQIMIGPTDTVISTYLDKIASNGFNKTSTIVPGMELRMDCSFNKTNNGNELAFNIQIDQNEINVASGLALLIYNSMNERIAIVDMRSKQLFTTSSTKKSYSVTGSIKNLQLVEGTYDLGIYIESNKFQGNKYHISRFEIPSVERDIVPYPVRDRGHVEVNATFNFVN
jgi:lipopolysaccharide transport system ATP-binding protein